MISVIVPTIASRAEFLAECKSAYAAHTENYELIVVPDKPTCGEAWVEGAAKASGDFIHFTADDLRPHRGWADAAVETCGRGFLPAPRILNDDGTVQSCGGSDGWETEWPTGRQTDFSRIPFLPRHVWDDIEPLVVPFLRHSHYWTDNCVSFAARKLGHLTGVHRAYEFTHSLAEAGRGAGMTWEQRMIADRERYEQWAVAL